MDPTRAVGGYPSTRYDTVDVRMMVEALSPGMQDCGQSDPGAEMLWIGGDGGESLRRGREQQSVDLRFVLIRDGAELCRQGEDHMEIGYGQQLSLAGLQPFFRRRHWHLDGDSGTSYRQSACGRSLRIARHVRRAQRCDRFLSLTSRAVGKAHMPVVRCAPSFAVAAEDIRHLQRQPRHLRRSCRSCSSMFRASRGLFISRIVLTATRA